MKLKDITKGSEYALSLFSEEKIADLESRIVVEEGKKGSIPSISAINSVNHRVMRFTPFSTPGNIYSL